MMTSLTNALVVLVGAFVGATSMRSWDEVHLRPTFHTWAYYSETGGRLTLGIRPDGQAEIGEHYDRATEALKLVELARQFRDEGRYVCYDAAFSVPDRGWLRVYPGQAGPVPPATDQRL